MTESIRVLLVDDDPDFADVTAHFIEHREPAVTADIEVSVEEGLARIENEAFDCIVCDYDMPIMDGIAFLEAVRAKHPDLPFILFTGKGSEEVASEAITAGVTDYLQKSPGPERYDLLVNRITNSVERYRAQLRAARQERILTLLGEVNRQLLKARRCDEIEEAVVSTVVSTEPYRLAWIGDFDADRNRIAPRRVAGIDPADTSPIDGVSADDQGAVLEAIEAGKLTLADPADPTLHIWADRNCPIDAVSAAVVPIVYHDRGYGVLALYADRVDCFDDAECEMLEEIVGDTAQALRTAEVNAHLERHRTAVEAVPEGVFLLDDQGTIELVNERAATIFSRSRDELVGAPFEQFVTAGVFDEAVIPWYLETVRSMLSDSSDIDEARYETEISLPSGEERLLEIHLTLQPYDDDFRGSVGIVRSLTER